MTYTQERFHKTVYLPDHQEKKVNIFFGVAFEIEKPILNVVNSFHGVLTAPVDFNTRSFRGKEGN